MPTGGKILVVDDNELNRMFLREILEAKYQVLEAENGQEALKVIAEHPHEIGGIILDLIMPVMDGYAFLENFRGTEFDDNIPVLVATSDGKPDVERRCLELGAWDFVQKPYDPVIVSLRIENSMDRRRLYVLEQQRILDTFQRYVDPSIAKELLKDDVSAKKLMGKRTEIVVLFVDIREFTSLSEKMDSDIIVSVLNEYLMLTSGCIKKYDGTLDKFIGDCTMAIWGAPLPCDDAVYKACKAAMEMADKSRTLSERFHKLYGQEISYGIGIHMGPAIVGNIGTMERMDYTAIGSTVNTASRLEAKAPAGTIYISRAVADALGERARTTSLGNSVKLKGKPDDFEVLTLDTLM